MGKYKSISLFSDVRQRAKKAGQPPGTLVYTGDISLTKPLVTLTAFDANNCRVMTTHDMSEVLFTVNANEVTGINVDGLQNVDSIKQFCDHFSIHALTVEDILNIEQRPKAEEFDEYLFLTLKILCWSTQENTFSIQQISIVLGKTFILTFLASSVTIFDSLRIKLQSGANQHLRQQHSDYLAYRMLDAIVDEYFVVLECLGEQIESVESKIISEPTPQNSKTIYGLKHQMLLIRKSIWPLREVINHLLYENIFITKFTRTYLRDLYDHTMQAIDTTETCREMLSSLLDMYLSGLTIRMNEIMKTLTIITTIFIPITSISSVYGMNLPNIPLMKSSWGFGIVAATMTASVVFMMIYFRRKKWI